MKAKKEKRAKIAVKGTAKKKKEGEQMMKNHLDMRGQKMMKNHFACVQKPGQR